MHIHTSDDPFDGRYISYSAEGVIMLAREYGYHYISITNHEKAFENERLLRLRDYAQKNNIVFIPGVEKRIQNKDILLYFDYDLRPNATLKKIRTFEDIRTLKKQGWIRLVIIPHPFFHFHSMGSIIEDYQDIIDGIEHSWFYTVPGVHSMYSLFYTAFLNMNIKGASFARAHRLPLIASGDLHTLDWFDKDFTRIRCDHTLESLFQVFSQFKQHHLTNDQLDSLFKIKTAPLEQKKFKKEAFKIMRHIIKHYSLHPWHLFT